MKAIHFTRSKLKSERNAGDSLKKNSKEKKIFIRHHYHYTIHKWHHLESINCVWMDFWFQRWKPFSAFCSVSYSFHFGLSVLMLTSNSIFFSIRHQNILHPKIDKANVLQLIMKSLLFLITCWFLLFKWECEMMLGDLLRRDKALSIELNCI